MLQRQNDHVDDYNELLLNGKFTDFQKKKKKKKHLAWNRKTLKNLFFYWFPVSNFLNQACEVT